MRPTVSIIIPCRNEVRFIGSCLDSVLNNGFPLEELEILVIDGMSNDGTRGIIEDYAAHYPFIRLIDNVKKVTPYAINIGIRAATGAILMRLDAHTICDKNYIAQCIRVVNNYGADDVGGTLRITARDNTVIGRSIVKALTLKFGVGNLKYRFSQPEEPEIVDTVAFFCCKREVFEKIGMFNEKLTRIQDMEFKRRLARAGGKIMLAPGAFADYQARSDFKSFWKHNWSDGLWTVLAFAHAELMPVRPRHLAPACLVSALLVTGLLGPVLPISLWAFFGIAALYAAVALLLALRIALQDREWRFAFLVPFTIATMHGMRGFGSLWGVVRLLGERRLGHAFRLVINEQSA
jgi:glycosyltransferase involved in cell wall biosynthesis